MKCRICEGDQLYLWNEQLDMRCPDNYPLDGQLKIGVCQECGFVANVGKSQKADFDNYYLSINKHHTRSELDTEIDKKYFRTLCEFLMNDADFNFKNSEICDFGSGALAFSNIATSLGGNCVSYDIGANPESYKDKDLVITTHTFEHIFDLRDAMHSLRNMARNGGLVAVAVPDFSTYSNYSYGPFNHFDLEHINHFKESSLRTLLEFCGFDFVTSRLGRREVRPRLYYSEILVVARRNGQHVKKEITETNLSPVMDNLASVLMSSYKPWKNLSDIVNITYSQVRSDSRACFCGLSSFAFRVLNYIKSKDCHVDVYTDTDKRLSKYMFGESAIKDKDEFISYAMNAKN